VLTLLGNHLLKKCWGTREITLPAMDYIYRCKALDQAAKKDWLFRQEPFQMVKEPWSTYIKLEIVLRGAKWFCRTDLLKLSALFSHTPYPLRVSHPSTSMTEPMSVGNTPYFGSLATFPLPSGYDVTLGPVLKHCKSPKDQTHACNELVLRFSSLDDPFLVEVMSLLNPYLEPFDAAKLYERVDYYK